MQDSREKIAEIILRQGELKLSAQLMLATAADQRATTLSAIFSAIAVALIGGAATTYANDGIGLALLLSAMLSGLLYLLASAMCAYAARPVDFYTAGNQPNKWIRDRALEKEPQEALLKEAGNYQKGIITNRGAIRQNANRLRNALKIGWLSPIVGFGLWLVLFLFQAAVRAGMS